MIDNHEPVMPTGLRRTYPNLMTGEGMRGQEYNAWSDDGGNPTDHTTIIPLHVDWQAQWIIHPVCLIYK